MSFPLDTSVILDLAAKQWLLKANQLIELNDLTEVKGPKVIITDFGDSLTRVDTVMSSKQYAEAIIEKSLRDRGDTDGASKVLILDSETNANTTRSLFTAVSADQFAKYWTLAAQHSDHCLLVPITSVLLRLAKSQGKGCHAVVLHYAQHIDMLITFNGSARASLRVSSSSMDEDDWQRAINYIAAEMKQVAVDVGHELNSVNWLDWNPDSSETATLNLSDKLTDALGLPVTVLESKELKLSTGSQIKTALPAVINSAKATDAINGLTDKSLFYTERALPWLAGLLLAFSGALAASGVYWQNLAQTQQQQTTHFLANVDESQLLIMQERTIAYKNEYTSKQQGDYAFVAKMQQALALPSIAAMMNDIRESLPKGVKVSLLAIDHGSQKNAAPTGFIIEGRIFKSLAETNADLEYMTQRLIEHGYHVQDNGLVNKENNHVFQLILTME
ncbi:MAG: hypothetical protein HRT92_06510 [Piscirickettsiaceae bacterium]|nr:hypothetical protein [Piscirickettsiaceae bacterium]